ncbi:MAG: Gfo/Idh/MocA family oxidoreductase, partial [Nitrospinota bacterium]|nr:Gfo/Idh/MocA family oxidoreductase [Nitrospinota bacterium]
RRWFTAREHVAQGRLGDITSAATRAFVNQMVGVVRLGRNEDRSLLSPMVISGTHALDASLFILGNSKQLVEVTSRSVTRTMVGLGTQDATFNIFTFDDGSIWSMDCSWGMPINWPASTYSLTVGIIGTEGALTIDDTHADTIMATEKPLPSHRGEGDKRNVHLLWSYPAGDISDGQFWGPMREESNAWLAHIYTGIKTPHATGAEGQRNLLLTMACDLSAKRKKPVVLPIEPEALHAELTAYVISAEPWT